MYVLNQWNQYSVLKCNTITGCGHNREHMWPRSFGVDDSGEDFRDMIGLRLADADVNSARSNKKFDQLIGSNGQCLPAFPGCDVRFSLIQQPICLKYIYIDYS